MPTIPVWNPLPRVAAIDHPLGRFAGLWAVGAVAFTGAWTVGYLLLPPGLLRGVFPVATAPLGADGLVGTLLRVVGYNLVVAGGLIVLGNTVRVRETPVGFVIPLAHAALFGLFLGTDSFAVAQGAPVAPSLATALSSPGTYEITSYVALAAATARLTLIVQPRWLTLRAERVGSWRELSLAASEWALLAGAVGLLVLANVVEAVSITT